MRLCKLLLAVGLLLTSAITQAGVVFQSAAFNNISAPQVNAWCSSCSGTYQVFDNFILNSATQITGTNFAIQTGYGVNQNITISLWDSTHTTQLFSQTVTASSYTQTNLPGLVTLIGANLSGPILAAGSYYVSWYNPVQLAIPGYVGGNTLYQSGIGLHNNIAAFQMLGNPASVPEPASLALLGLGLVGLIQSRRRNLS